MSSTIRFFADRTSRGSTFHQIPPALGDQNRDLSQGCDQSDQRISVVGTDKSEISCPVCDYEGKVCPRCEMYERLPHARWFQAGLTFITGVPYRGQRPFFKNTPVTAVSVVAGVLTGSTLLNLLTNVTIFGCNSVAFITPLMAVTLTLQIISAGAFRAMHQFVMHNASHDNLGQHSAHIGETAVFVAGTLPSRQYRSQHDIHHAHLTRTDDPDQMAIAALGFVPGRTINWYWWRLLTVLIMPRFALASILARLRMNLDLRSPGRLIGFTMLHMAPALVSTIIALRDHTLLPVLATISAWYLPLSYGTFASSVIYGLGLHRWYHQTMPETTGFEAYLAKTGARFFADSCPPVKLSGVGWMIAWLKWWLRLLFLHGLFSKLGVIGVTDNQHHDAHHAAPRGERFDFSNSAYSRHLIAQEPRFSGHFWHTWSLFGAISDNFVYMASLHEGSTEKHTNQDLSEAMAHLSTM